MNAVTTISHEIDPVIVESLVINGDLSKLNPAQKVALYRYRCQQVGLDPSAKPFDLLTLNGKQVLYANAGCTQQLCAIHKLKTAITAREKVDDIYTVCARVESPDGRFSENMGAVPLTGLKGDALANAFLKATTKAIRRTVLAHVGLGMLDETEVETIPNAAKLNLDPRGDLSQVDNSLRDKHVSAIADILNQDKDEFGVAQDARDYIAEYLQQFQELYISVADELAAQKIISKGKFKELLLIGAARTRG
jgi:hypothetical protein